MAFTVGNEDVVKMFEYWADEARRGDLMYGAVSVVKRGDKAAYDYAGAYGIEEQCIEPLKVVLRELDGIIESRALGPRDFKKGANFVEFPLSTGFPICWDFLIWLIDAEMTRRREKAPGPLRIAFTRDNEIKNQYDQTMFLCVMQQLPCLLGGFEDADAVGGRHKPLYTPIDIVVNSLAGEEVPKLNAPLKARRIMSAWLHGERPLTITLREAHHWPARNSNLDAWLKFAGDMQRKGEHVIILRDTEKAIDPLPGFCTSPVCSYRTDLRMALYEHAKCNLFLSNGPAGLGLFSDVPYLYFNKADGKHDADYAPNNPGWWKKSNGIGFGEQWPWATKTQKLLWQQDTYENICAAWEEMEPQLKDREYIDWLQPRDLNAA